MHVSCLPKPDSDERKRLVMVKLASREQRNTFLKNKAKLKRENNWKDVYVSCDMTKKRETRELPAAKKAEGKKRKGRASQTAVRHDSAGTGAKKPPFSESINTNETRNVNNVHVAHRSISTKLYIKCILINARSIVKK